MSARLKHVLLVILGAVFIMAVTVASLIARDNKLSNCSVPVAYIGSSGTSGCGVYMYRKGSAPRKVGSVPEKQLLAYDAKNDSWICMNDHYGSEKEPKVVNHGKVSAMKLEGMADKSIMACRVAGDTLFALYPTEDDRIRIAAYNFDGYLKYEHDLQGLHYSDTAVVASEPGAPIAYYHTEPDFSVARDGTVALVVTPKGKYSDLCIFDAKGRLVKRIDRGLNPSLDPSGTKLIIDEGEYKVDSDHGKDCHGPNARVMLDLKTGSKRAIPVLKGHYWSTVLPSSVGGPSNIHWSPDGKWLIGESVPVFLGLEWMDGSGIILYAADLNERSLKWRPLKDINEYNSTWLPLTEKQMEALRKH